MAVTQPRPVTHEKPQPEERSQPPVKLPDTLVPHVYEKKGIEPDVAKERR